MRRSARIAIEENGSKDVSDVYALVIRLLRLSDIFDPPPSRLPVPMQSPLRLAILLFVLAAAAQAQPSVPPLSGRVVDRAEVLSPSTEQALTDQLAAHERATSNQVVVLTVPSLEGVCRRLPTVERPVVGDQLIAGIPNVRERSIRI